MVNVLLDVAANKKHEGNIFWKKDIPKHLSISLLPFNLKDRNSIMNTQVIPLLDNQFVDMKFITKLTGLTDKWFYKLIQDGEFPKPIKLGRSSRWLKSEVENWLQQRITESRS